MKNVLECDDEMKILKKRNQDSISKLKLMMFQFQAKNPEFNRNHN